MINKYSETKIKDVDVKIMKNGVEYVKSISAAMNNANATYDLVKLDNAQKDAYVYKPMKTTYYYY